VIKIQNIAILTSGGDSPGMNACIKAITSIALHHHLGIFGIQDGFNGLINNQIFPISHQHVSSILQRGGTILGTARCPEFLIKENRDIAYHNLKAQKIDALIVIGGDGSFKGASVFANEFNFPVVGIPGTIDNDIEGTDYTIGFDTALNTICEAIDKIRDTANSHHRIFLVEVMGNNSGVLALNAALASGADSVFLPECTEDFVKFEAQIIKVANTNRSSIIIVAEGDQIGGAQNLYTHLNNKGMAEKIRVVILGHIQRGGAPSFNDRLNATLFGEKAVELLLAGTTKQLIGIQNGKVSHQPFTENATKSTLKNPNFLSLIEKLGN
jgi:6-phosphofructokinase 1